MTHKAIVYSAHARKQMTARGIIRSDVHWLLAKGERRGIVHLGGGETESFKSGRIRGRDAEVLYIETQTAS